MKNLTKSLLATLMIMGLFSTNASAWVDCEGLQGYVRNQGWYNDLSDCRDFQKLYGNTGRDWKSKKTGIIRRSGVEWNGTNEYMYGGNSSSDSYQEAIVEKVEEPKTMTMDEIRAYKFDPALNDTVTKTEKIIAKTLIEKYDLWAIYSKGGGAGIRAKLKEIGLLYAGGEVTDYSKNIHAGNIFVYMDQNFTALEVMKLAKIKAKDFVDMNISIQDVFDGKISSRKLSVAYGEMLKKQRDAKLTSL